MNNGCIEISNLEWNGKLKSDVMSLNWPEMMINLHITDIMLSINLQQYLLWLGGGKLYLLREHN